VAETTNSDAHEEGADTGEAFYQVKGIYTHIHEILFSTTDKPKLLSPVSSTKVMKQKMLETWSICIIS